MLRPVDRCERCKSGSAAIGVDPRLRACYRTVRCSESSAAMR